jgi:hypothetical protein
MGEDLNQMLGECQPLIEGETGNGEAREPAVAHR